MGKDTTLFHHRASDDETDTESRYVFEAHQWFDSIWETVAVPMP